MSNTPISSVIRTASTMNTLTGTHCCHPHTLTLIVTRKHNQIILFDGDELCHRLIKNLAPWTTQECYVDQWCWNHNGNICWAFRSSLFRNTWLGISLKIQGMVQRLIGILKFRLSSINLEGMMSVFL